MVGSRADQADTIFYGGAVHTMDARDTVSDAVAVRAGRIVAVGSADVAAWRGPRSELVNLRGRALLPGFQDAHIHPTAGGLGRLRCDLTDIHGRAEYEQAIGSYVRTHPDVEWILGAGWYGDAFEDGFPDRATLDAIEPDRPVALTSHDMHGLWVNTSALTRAGITSLTPDPAAGRIHRDAAGEPTGMLTESAAERVTDLLPAVTPTQIEAALLNAQSYLHGLGITAWQDAAVGDALGMPDAYEAYCALARRGQLTGKVTGALWWDRDADFDAQLAELCRRRESAPGGAFHATAVKVMQDGVCENFTASMLEPYNRRGDECGTSFIAPQQLCRIVRALDEHCFDVHVHAVGDRAVHESVDAVEQAQTRMWGSRHQVTHIDLICRPDIDRMARSGIIANVQPLWARRDPVLVSTKLPYLTGDQQARHFVFGSLAEAGVTLAFSSDWPVSSPNPLWGAHVAVNRKAPPEDPHARDEESQSTPLLPAEGVGAHEALAPTPAVLHGRTGVRRARAQSRSASRRTWWSWIAIRAACDQRRSECSV